MSTFSCQTLVSKYLFTTKETRSPWENSWLQAWEGEDRKSTGEPVVLCHARRGACSLSHFSARLFATPRTLAHQAPLSKGFSWQEKWSGLPFPPSGDLPHPGIQPVSPALQTDSLLLRHRGEIIWRVDTWRVTFYTLLCFAFFFFFIRACLRNYSMS